MIEQIKVETKRGRKKTASPVSSGPVMVIRKDDTVIASINPHAIGDFAKEHSLDVRALEYIVNRPYCNHNGYTVVIEGGNV